MRVYKCQPNLPRGSLQKDFAFTALSFFKKNFFSRSQAEIHFSDRFPVVFLSCQAILRFTGTVKAKKVFAFRPMMQSRVVSSHVEGPVAGLGLTARIIC